MEILITGSNGFLGNKIFHYLKSEHQVFGLNRSKSDYNLDLSKEIPVFNRKFSLVIHCAGKAHSVPKNEIESSVFFETNVLGTENLIKGFNSNNKPNEFVFISSVSVYGLNEGILIKENSPLLATEPYGRSKVEAEEIIHNWCKKNNVICTILRLPLVVFSNPPGNLGSMIRSIQKRYYFNIAGGDAKKSMVLASDIVNDIMKVAKIGGIYNLTDGYHPTFKELSKNISMQLGQTKVWNMPLILATVLSKIGDLVGAIFPLNSKKLKKITSTLTFDDTKARFAFGWNPTPILKGFKIRNND